MKNKPDVDKKKKVVNDIGLVEDRDSQGITIDPELLEPIEVEK